MMVKIRCLLFIALMSLLGHALAADEEVPLQQAQVDVSDQESLQRGARLYMNFCSGCHSLQYLRYSTMAQGLGLLNFDETVDKDLLNNLVFTQAKVTDPINIAMPLTDARQWFGTLPPDLTLEAKIRSADWIYSYLLSFYRDPTRPFGSNNWVYPEVAMPNILEPLQGEQIAVYQTKKFIFEGKQHESKTIAYLQLVASGKMNQYQFKSAVNDIVNFLAYVSEPNRTERESLGFWIVGFLLILLVLVYLLKRSYWEKLS